MHDVIADKQPGLVSLSSLKPTHQHRIRPHARAAQLVLATSLQLFSGSTADAGEGDATVPLSSISRLVRHGSLATFRVDSGLVLDKGGLVCFQRDAKAQGIGRVVSRNGSSATAMILAERVARCLRRGDLVFSRSPTTDRGEERGPVVWGDSCNSTLQAGERALGVMPAVLQTMETGTELHSVQSGRVAGALLPAEAPGRDCVYFLRTLDSLFVELSIGHGARREGYRLCVPREAWVSIAPFGRVYLTAPWSGIPPPQPTNQYAPPCPLPKRRSWADVVCLVDRDGKAANVWVVGASDPSYGTAARTAVEQWAFSPTLRNEVPVPSLFGLRVLCGG